MSLESVLIFHVLLSGVVCLPLCNFATNPTNDERQGKERRRQPEKGEAGEEHAHRFLTLSGLFIKDLSREAKRFLCHCLQQLSVQAVRHFVDTV
jgi:hypothetical protein